MKKSILLMLAVLVLSFVFGCSAKTEQATQVAENSNSASASKQKLVVALNAEFPPYEFKDNGDIVGIDPDMIREIGKRLDMEVEFLDIAFDSIIPAIQSGKADVAATGMTVTEDRKQFVNFTDMYQDAKQMIIVKNGSPIKTKDDLIGKKIAVQTGTTGDLYCTDEYGDDAMQRYSKIIDGVQALNIDKVDACVVDDQVAKACVDEVNASGADLIILDTAYTEEHYAMALNKNNTELLSKINKALNDMKNDGTLKQIKSKYIAD